MRLITTEEQLRSHIPNMIPAVKGEPSLLDRLDSFLVQAERWVMSRFTGSTVFEAIADMNDKGLDTDPTMPLSLSDLHDTLCSVVCTEALHRALPALDIVLTPTGFGVVSTTNIAPASQHRVDRLARELVNRRDECIDTLLQLLRSCRAWHGTEQARFFADTLFVSLSVVDAVGHEAPSRWLAYQDMRPEILGKLASIEAKYISPELMEALRLESLTGSPKPNRLRLARALRTYIVERLKGMPPHSRRLPDLVQFIRTHPEDFPEWHASETARLWEPPLFRNQKKSAGYWF